MCVCVHQKKRAEEAAANGGGQEQQPGSHGGKTRKGSTRDDLAQALRDNILSQVGLDYGIGQI